MHTQSRSRAVPIIAAATLTIAALAGIALSQVVTLTSSNLPLIIVDTKGVVIDSIGVDADMGIIDNGPGLRNTITDARRIYNGRIRIKLRGQTSRLLFDAKPYAIELKDSAGKSCDLPLLGMPADDDWVLQSPYFERSLVRNALVYRTYRTLGRWAPRTRFCEMLLNGQYAGMYILMEHIKQGTNRVNIADLRAWDTTGDQLTGGYMVKLDKPANEPNECWTSPYRYAGHDVRYYYVYPKRSEILPKQRDYIRTWITRFEDMMNGADWNSAATGYTAVTNIESLVDFFLINEWAKNIDGFRLSTYLYKDKDSRDPRLSFGPPWDFDLSLGSAINYEGESPQNWITDLSSEGRMPSWETLVPPFWWKKIFADPVFKSRLRTRWVSLKTGVLNPDSVCSVIDSMAAVLGEAQERYFRKYPILGKVDMWNSFSGKTGATYAANITYLKNWIRTRSTWIDGALAPYPILSAVTRSPAGTSTGASTPARGLMVMVDGRIDGVRDARVFDITGRRVGARVKGVKGVQVVVGATLQR